MYSMKTWRTAAFKDGDMGMDFLKIVYESTTNIRTKLKRNNKQVCRMFATVSLFDHNCQDAHRLSTTRTVNLIPPNLFPSFYRKRNLSSILSRFWTLLTCLSFHFLLIIIRHNLFGMQLRNRRYLDLVRHHNNQHRIFLHLYGEIIACSKKTVIALPKGGGEQKGYVRLRIAFTSLRFWAFVLPACMGG